MDAAAAARRDERRVRRGQAPRAGGARPVSEHARSRAVRSARVVARPVRARLAGRGLAPLGRRPDARLAGRDLRCARATTGRCLIDNAARDARRGAARAGDRRRSPASRSRSRCTCSARCATPPTRCSWPRRRSRSWCSRPLFVLAFDYGIGPEARDRRADLLLPDHGQPARRPALGRARAAQADAQHGRLAAAHAARRWSCPPRSRSCSAA